MSTEIGRYPIRELINNLVSPPSPIDRMKNKVIANLYMNTSLEELEHIERYQKVFMKANNKTYIEL